MLSALWWPGESACTREAAGREESDNHVPGRRAGVLCVRACVCVLCAVCVCVCCVLCVCVCVCCVLCVCVCVLCVCVCVYVCVCVCVWESSVCLGVACTSTTPG